MSESTSQNMVITYNPFNSCNSSIYTKIASPSFLFKPFLQDYIPEIVANFSDFEDPPSPPSSYDNTYLNEEEFSKPPPELPPQLPVAIRHEASSSASGSRFVPRPTHLELNHLYIHKTDRGQFVALRSTYKFQHKYITTELYKSLRRERWWSIKIFVCYWTCLV